MHEGGLLFSLAKLIYQEVACLNEICGFMVHIIGCKSNHYLVNASAIICGLFARDFLDHFMIARYIFRGCVYC